MEQIKYPASKLILELSEYLDKDYNLFYTEEYIEILQGRQKGDSSITEETDGQILKMLVYALKNNKIKFEDEYFKTILEILMGYTNSQVINTNIYNLFIAVLSFSYDEQIFLTMQDDKKFLKTIRNLSEIALPLLFEIYNANKDAKPLFEKLRKYSPVIMGIIMDNENLIKNVYFHYDKPIYNAFNLKEREAILIIIASFMEHIKRLDYNYSLITQIAIKVRIYLMENISSFYDNSDLYEEKIVEMEDIIAEMMEPKCNQITKYLH